MKNFEVFKEISGFFLIFLLLSAGGIQPAKSAGGTAGARLSSFGTDPAFVEGTQTWFNGPGECPVGVICLGGPEDGAVFFRAWDPNGKKRLVGANDPTNFVCFTAQRRAINGAPQRAGNLAIWPVVSVAQNGSVALAQGVYFSPKINEKNGVKDEYCLTTADSRKIVLDPIFSKGIVIGEFDPATLPGSTQAFCPECIMYYTKPSDESLGAGKKPRFTVKKPVAVVQALGIAPTGIAPAPDTSLVSWQSWVKVVTQKKTKGSPEEEAWELRGQPPRATEE